MFLEAIKVCFMTIFILVPTIKLARVYVAALVVVTRKGSQRQGHLWEARHPIFKGRKRRSSRLVLPLSIDNV